MNIASSSDLGVQQNEYILESKQYLARCDSCRKAVSLGEDWYHKQAEGLRLSSARNAVDPLDSSNLNFKDSKEIMIFVLIILETCQRRRRKTM